MIMAPLRTDAAPPTLHPSEPASFWSSRYAVGLLVFGAIALYFLLTEHRAHFIGALPFLFLAACPLMHIFMHHDHGGHAEGEAHHHDNPQAANAPPTVKAGERS